MTSICIYNRQRGVPVEMEWLRVFARVVLPHAATCKGKGEALLEGLPEIDVALVSSRTIAGIHRRFMGLPGATDVITFLHGEIVIGAGVAQDRAPEFGHAIELEIALYLVHGLLHLNGFDDAIPSDASQMRTAQNRIWRACLKRMPNLPPII